MRRASRHTCRTTGTLASSRGRQRVKRQSTWNLFPPHDLRKRRAGVLLAGQDRPERVERSLDALGVDVAMGYEPHDVRSRGDRDDPEPCELVLHLGSPLRERTKIEVNHVRLDLGQVYAGLVEL